MSTTSQKNRRRTAAAALVGTAVEYYDFALYGAAAAVVFNRVFFPGSDPTTAVLASFATYAVGFAARPIGGMLFGSLGDRFGRKPMLIVTLILMGLATALIGCIPDYRTIGIWAPILLIVLRLVQGLGAGAEYAGAVALSTETAGRRGGGLFGALPGTGSYIGSLAALLVFQLVTRLDEQALLTWGWRIAFILALPLLGISLWIRTHVYESAEFQATKSDATTRPRGIPLTQLFTRYKIRTLIGLGLNFTLTGYSYVIQVYSVSYMVNQLSMTESLSLIIAACGYGAGIILLPIWGLIGDKLGPQRVFITATALSIAYIVPFWMMIDTKNAAIAAIAVVIGLPVFIGAQFSTQPIIYKRLFPVEVRYSGIAFSREVTGAALGGTAPLAAAALISSANGSWAILAAAMAAVATIALIAGIATLRLPSADTAIDSKQPTLPHSPPQEQQSTH